MIRMALVAVILGGGLFLQEIRAETAQQWCERVEGARSVPYGHIPGERIVDWMERVKGVDSTEAHFAYIRASIYATVELSERKTQRLQFLYTAIQNTRKKHYTTVYRIPKGGEK